MPLNGFICISLAIYVRICVFSYLFIYVAAKVIINSTKNDAQNRVICAILGIFCKESGKLWGKMKKKWENVWLFQIYFVHLHRQTETE